jgi:heat shock protein HtpX
MDPIYESIAANKRWTYLFFLFYAILIGAIGYLIGIYFGSPIFGLFIAAIIFVLAFLVSYYGGQSMVTTMAGAKKVSKQEEPYLYNTVEALSIAAGLPMPKLYMINTDDVLLATVAIVLAGTIVFLGFMARYSAYGGLFRGGRGSQNNPAGIVLLILLIVLIILAPLFAQLLKFAISRKREFLADATGADLTGYPEGLASALEKISTMQKPKSKIQNKALNGIYIVSPAVGANKGSNLYSTHPPTEERVRRLREMEFIDQKYVKPLNTDMSQSNLGTTSENMNFVAGTAPINKKHVGRGYLVCDKCNRYYELQPGESPDDFTDKCECGGTLKHVVFGAPKNL